MSDQNWIASEPWEDRTVDLFDLSLEVLPDEFFSNEYSTADNVPREETGPNSYAIKWLLVSSCAGWPKKPTASEAYKAFQEEQPTNRQNAIMRVLIREGDLHEWCNAWYEGAFTWRQMARAVRNGTPWTAGIIRRMNRMREWNR